MEVRQAEIESLSYLNSGPSLAETSYDFLGIVVRIRSNAREVVSSFDRAYEFFRRSDEVPPHLEIILLAQDGDAADAEGRKLYARFPPDFDAWRASLLRWVPNTPRGRLMEQSIQEVDAWVDPRGYRLCRLGRIEAWSVDWYQGLESLVFSFVMHYLSHLCTLHAGAVSRDGKGLIFCGSPGSGKSTLSYALARHGYQYLSDEYALFAPASLEVFPFPRSINFSAGAAEIFPELKPLLEETSMVGKGQKRVLSLESLGIKPAREPARASFLFLLTHQAGAAPELKPLAASEAVERLVKGLDLGVFSPLERRNFTRSQAAAILGRTARCYELLSGDLGKTVRLIESLVAEP